MLGFSSLIISKHVANVNNLVLSIDKEYLLDGFLLFKFLGQKFLYRSIMQLSHSSRINNDTARLLCCSLEITLDCGQFIGLRRLNLVQYAVNHDICRFSSMAVANGYKFNSKSMPSKSVGSLQLMIPWRNTGWNNNFSWFMRHCIHLSKEQGNKAKGFENKTNTSEYEVFVLSVTELGSPQRTTFKLIIGARIGSYIR